MSFSVFRRFLLILGLALVVLPATAQDNNQGGISLAEYERLHKELNLKNQPWATIPWKPTVSEARAQAVAQPVFIPPATIRTAHFSPKEGNSHNGLIAA